MKWQHYLTSVCFAFLGLFAGSFIINQNSASAVSESIVMTSTSTYTWNLSFVPRYFIFTFNNPSSYSANGNINFMIGNNTFAYQSTYRCNFYLDWNTTTVSLSSYHLCKNPAYSTSLQRYFVQVPSTAGSPFSLFPDGFTITATDEEITFGSGPSGSLSITENGTYDVTNYAEAVVEVPDTETIIQGDYHDDLVSINNSIMVCAGVCLVLYFFYCIYRIFIKTGGK